MSNLFRLMKQLKRGLGGEPVRRAGRGPTGEVELADDLLRVDPRETDPELSDWFDPHIITLDPSVPASGRLLLFLSGSYGHPGRQTSILRCAAAAGHRAINLTYPNSWTVASLCKDSRDPDAHGKVRMEITEGAGGVGPLKMPPADSIQNRLTKLLQWLVREQPGEIWKEFISEGQINWGKIEVAGHSQGGGHAAFIAKRHEVAKVIMLGAPSDHCSVRNRPGAWLYERGLTPAERHLGFCHLRDPGFRRVTKAWELLGMPAQGSLVNVDLESSPYAYSHSLVTDLQVPGGKFHGSVATDAAAPRTRSGTIAFQPVWDYLFRS